MRKAAWGTEGLKAARRGKAARLRVLWELSENQLQALRGQKIGR